MKSKLNNFCFFFSIGCIQQIAAIQCYKCQEYGDHCSLPFTIEGGEEHNENDIPSIEYDPDYVCEVRVIDWLMNKMCTCCCCCCLLIRVIIYLIQKLDKKDLFFVEQNIVNH